MASRRALSTYLSALGYQLQEWDSGTTALPPLCAVPGGDFLMGSTAIHDPQAHPNELPQHRLALPGFEIARYSVTVEEYGYAIHAGVVRPPWRWRIQALHQNYPVVNVAWQEAVDYADWLAHCTGQLWRVPSEAEWEKAARGPSGRIFPWGDTWDPTLAKVAGESEELGPAPVGSHPRSASPYGAEDMAGNVWEWTTSLHYPYPYTSSDGREDMKVAADIPDNLTDERHARVMRGGSWDEGESFARAAMRGIHVPPWNSDGYIGFRLVRGPLAP